MSVLPARLGRLQFFGWLVAGVISLIVVTFVVASFGASDNGPNPLHWLLVLAVLGWIIFYIGVLAPRRLRDMGQNPLWALALMIPLVNFVVLIFLLATPTKKIAGKTS